MHTEHSRKWLQLFFMIHKPGFSYCNVHDHHLLNKIFVPVV